MDENKFPYKEVFVRYDNVQIGVMCSKMVEKVFSNVSSTIRKSFSNPG